MATNKHAVIRYQALDRCFSNRYREFYINDLISACNDALREFYDSKEDIKNDEIYYVKRRTIFNDINFMKSHEGWDAPIKPYYVGKKCYYRYEDPDFSINKKDLSDAELDKLSEALVMLNRFKGMEGFSWIDEFITNFEDKLGRRRSASPVIGYEQNPFLKGISFLSPLFNYIVNKQALSIGYTTFSAVSRVCTFHPYFLKQYNNRWFLFGLDESRKDVVTSLALDRIDTVEPAQVPYVPNDRYDFGEYFEDVVGVSVPRVGSPILIKLKFDERMFPYVENKPIHGSQTYVLGEERTITLNVFDNYEVESEILSFGEHVEVLEPSELRDKIGERVSAMAEKYLLCK